ncbi:MAG: hypothetical protein AAF561_07960 [Planctomycetota bacterium]
MMTLSSSSSTAGTGSPVPLSEDVESLRQQRDAYREKLQRIADAIGCDDLNKVVHDVRNVLNERNLLRKLVDLDEA